MHRSVQRTLSLPAILVVLVLVDFMGVFIDPKEPGTLPNIPAVKESELTTLKIVRPEESVLFERRDNGWHIISPIEGPADQAAIQAIIQRLRRGISFDIEVEQNSQDLKAFGLDPGIFVEAKTADATEPISLYLGVDTAGGASFVRLPDDDTVYQAQVGGVRSYVRPSSQWQDPVVAGFDPKLAKQVSIETAMGRNTFTRASSSSAWTLAEDPAFPLDQDQVTTLVTSLAGLRAGGIHHSDHPSGLETPVATVQIKVDNQDPILLSFGRTLTGAFAKNTSKEQIYQIAPSFTASIATPKAGWYSRLLLNFERTQVHRMTLTEKGLGSTILEQDPATNRWTVVSPPNIDANLRECMQAAITLSSLRAIAMASATPKEAGFPSPNSIVVELLSGEKQTLELGRTVPGMPQGKEAVFARTPDTPDRIGVLPLRQIIKLRSAFSR